MRNVVDALLEISVLGSFTKVGIGTRRRLYGWSDPPSGALEGRTALVTGPTSGLGRAAAAALARLGARVVLVGRSQERLDGVRAELIATHGDDRFPTVVADLGSLASVTAAVQRIRSTEPTLDVVVDNAGAIYPERRESPDGIEATLAVMVVGPFALVSGLLPLLRATPDSRVIAVSSGGMYTQSLLLDDLGWTDRPFSGPRAYARAKRAQVMLVREWSRRLGAEDPAMVSMHPGWAATPGLEASLPGFSGLMGPLLRTPAEGIDTLVWLAAAPPDELAPLRGAFVHDRRARPFDRLPGTRVPEDERRRLWDAVVALAGIDDPLPMR